MARSKPRRPRKEKNIRTSLMRGIILIMFLTILIPIIAYNTLPEWVYYLNPGTRLWIAADGIERAYEENDLFAVLQDTEKQYDATIEITTADGKFVYSTQALIHSLPADLSEAEEVDKDYAIDYATKYGEKTGSGKGFLVKEYEGNDYTVTFLDCYVYLPSGDCVDIYMQISQVSSTTRISIILSFVVAMMSMVFALSVIWVYIKRLTQPIDEMVDTTKKMSQLDFSEKCPDTSIIELNSLSSSINDMSSALDIALTDLKQKNERLQEDIENERTIDNLRQTFVSGISHELKTPIAIIQGYAEGAKMFYAAGNTETADSYCDTIMQESLRMNEMIVKLLEITKYSSGAYEPVREDFELHGFVQDWFDRNEALLSEKGISYKNHVPAGLYGNGDLFTLASVLNNYLSNAVAHTEYLKVISVSCDETGASYRLRVFNTGKLIAQRDIDKIWNSFYRADKSLSRAQGRFGLGLSIVAAIQDLHGEAYGVNNLLTGVEFWFDIKKATGKNQ